MKSLRYVKLRTFLQSPEDIATERNHNPLRVRFELGQVSNDFTANHLKGFKEVLNVQKAALDP